MEIKQAEFYLQSHMKVDDYYVATVGMLNYRGTKLLTKPEPKEHYDAMIGLAQSVVDQELTSDNVKRSIAQMGAEKLSELGIMGQVFVLVDKEQVKHLLKR